MVNKPKNREEVLERIRGYNEKGVTYQDWWYDLLEVEVCDIDTGDGKVYRVPKFVGKEVIKIVDDRNKNNEMVALGNVRIRAYMIKRMEFKKERFTSMSNWAKGMLLKHTPDLLGEHEKDFSPRLKEHLSEIRNGSDKMETLFETITGMIPQ